MSDFLFVGRYSMYDVDYLSLDASGAPVAADAAPVGSFRRYDNDVQVFSRAFTPLPDVGEYRLSLSSAETSTQGLWYILVTYNVATIPQQYRIDIEIPSSSSSEYMQLAAAPRAIVEQTWGRFEDMFDSAVGGPHLKEYSQSSFGRERLAKLLRIAMNRLNSVAQPHQTFSLEGNDFPYTAFSGLLELALYVEAMKHLVRSYAEQPTAQGVQTVRLDRTDYWQRWQTIIKMEEKDLASALAIFKMSVLGLGRSSVLVAGGLYGEWERPMPAGRPRVRQPVGWL